jgi:MFS family permease
MVGTFVALAMGQLLIARVEVEATSPFMIVVVLFAGALVMVSATRAEQPAATPAAMLPYGQLTQAAPIATFGSVLSGLISGAFYALVPAWMQDEGVQRSTIALFMLAAVLGGLAFQIPVGSLSDRFDRRLVLVALALGFACAAVAPVMLPRSLSVVLPVAALLGGFMSTLYPVCVAHAHDCMPADRVVAVSSQLILVSGIGSVLGPLLGTSVMVRFDIYGLLYFMAAAAILLAVLAAAWTWSRPEPAHLERPFEILTPQATSLAHDPLHHSE